MKTVNDYYYVVTEDLEGERRYIQNAIGDNGLFDLYADDNGLFDLYADECNDEEEIVLLPVPMYILVSGEGTEGTVEIYEGNEKQIKSTLRRERSGGERWARMYKHSHANIWIDIDNADNFRAFPPEDVVELF